MHSRDDRRRIVRDQCVGSFDSCQSGYPLARFGKNRTTQSQVVGIAGHHVDGLSTKQPLRRLSRLRAPIAGERIRRYLHQAASSTNRKTFSGCLIR